MSRFTIVVPEYSRRFRCIGPKCEDDCCHGWVVPVDQNTLRQYLALPPGPLRSELETCIQPRTPDAAQPSFRGAASIRMLPSGACPFLTSERLCRIHREMGPSRLSETCAQFPRRRHRIDGIEEVALSLSCPEAARLVLLNPELRTSPVRRHKVRWNPSVDCSHPLRTFYWAIREFVTGLIADRSYALWQRLFLLGVFCQRLDAIAHGSDKRTFPAFITDFTAVVASGGLRGPMEAIPSNPRLQLQLVLQLLRLGAGNAHARPSLAACLSAFNAGIGRGEGDTPESQLARYTVHCAGTFEPFFRDRPWILENYLLNDLLGSAFPFGEGLFHKEATRDCMAAFEQLAVRFGILKGLLIGVAAARGSEFSTQHVVQTVTVVSRQFEHSHEFLAVSHAFLQENNLSQLGGLTALLRN